MKTSAEINAMNTSANGTDGREACSFCWFVARTQMNCERKAEKELQHIAKETYLPTQEEIHVWSDRKKKVQRVVIPMIIFVKMRSEDARHLHRTASFYGFIGHDRHNTTPAPIPEKDIETLRFMLGHSDNPVSIEPMPIKLGDRVKVIRGNLQGLEGYVMKCDDGATHILVGLNVLDCAKVDINIQDLQFI
jgi:transcription antitermination factor NusG